MRQRCQWSAAKAGVTSASKAARCHRCVPVNESRERVGLQAGLLSRQFHVTPLVQDAESECRVFRNTSNRERGIKSAWTPEKPPAQTGKPKHSVAAAQREAARVCQFTFAVALQMMCL